MASEKASQDTREFPAPSRPAALGWGLLSAWGLLSWVLPEPPIPGGSSLMTLAVSLFSVLFGAVLLIADALWRGSFERLVTGGWRPICIALGLLMSGCCVANQILRLLAESSAAAFAMQAVASLCYLSLMYLWFRVYAGLEAEELERLTIWSTALLGLVFLLGLVLIGVARVVLWVLLPLVSSALLSMQAKGVGGDRDGSTQEAAGTRPEGGGSPATSGPGGAKALAWTCVGVILCSLATNLPLTLDQQTSLAGHDMAQSALRLSGVVIAAGLALYCVAFARRINLPSFYKILFPLIALGSFLAALPSFVANAVGFCLCFSAQWMLYVFVWIYASEACAGDVSRAVPLFVLTRASFDAGGVIASLASIVLAAHPGLFGANAVYLCLLCWGGGLRPCRCVPRGG